jgi:hypothetical protein
MLPVVRIEPPHAASDVFNRRIFHQSLDRKCIRNLSDDNALTFAPSAGDGYVPKCASIRVI